MDILVQDIYRAPVHGESRSADRTPIKHGHDYMLTTKNAILMEPTNWDVLLSIGCYIKMKMMITRPSTSIHEMITSSTIYHSEQKGPVRLSANPASGSSISKRGRLNQRRQGRVDGVKRSTVNARPILPSQAWLESCKEPLLARVLSAPNAKHIDARLKEREAEEKKRRDDEAKHAVEKYKKEEADHEQDSLQAGDLDVLDLDLLIRGQTSTVESMLSRITNSAEAEETHLS